MINDDLLQYLADTDPVGLEHQMLCELKERAVRKIQAMSDDELLENFDCVGEIVEKRKGGES